MNDLHTKIIDYTTQDKRERLAAAIRKLEDQRGLSMSEASKTAITRTYLQYAQDLPIDTGMIVPRPFKDNPLDMARAAVWIDAHPKILRPTARFLIEQLHYIDQDHFEHMIEDSARAFQHSIGEGTYYTYIPEVRTTSMSWVMGLLNEKRLIQRTAIPSALSTHNKKEPLNIVISDDCAYSGQHLYETMWEIHHVLRDQFARTPIHFHCIIPFMSTRALNFFLSCSKMGNYPAVLAAFKHEHSYEMLAKNTFLHLYHQETITTFNEQLQGYEMGLMERMIGYSALNLQFFGDRSPLFFQHKIADSLSVPRSLLRGRLIHSTKKRPFLEALRPPYKE